MAVSSSIGSPAGSSTSVAQRRPETSEASTNYGPDMAIDLIRRVDDVSAEWLTAVLRESGAVPREASVESLDVTAIGTGQMSQNHRFALDLNGAGPSSVVLKVAASDDPRAARPASCSASTSARSASTAARRRASSGPVADCHLARVRPCRGLVHARARRRRARCAGRPDRGLHRRGGTARDARAGAPPRAGVRRPAARHVAWLNQDRRSTRPCMASCCRLPRALRRRAIAPEHRELVRALRRERSTGSSPTAAPPLALVHGDYRLDNMLFGDAARREAADRRRLADRELGPADARRRLLPRRRP